VERQGGNIQADSLGEGQGATFTVKFPLLIPTTGSNNLVAPRLDISSEFKLNGLSILVVDDEADTRNWLKTSFEMHQAQVIAVASVDEAISQLDHFSPDVVISDIAMPSKDGYALVDELKRHHNQSGQPIPAIALTAHASLEDLEKSKIAGFQQHLAKPIKTEALIAVIIKLLEQCNPV
jgi:CheY-like chemotaxis protein